MIADICPKCGIGHLLQLVDADRDVAYCPFCETPFQDTVVRKSEVKIEERF